MIIVFALMIWLWRRFYAEDTSEAGGVKRLAKNSLAPIFLNLFIRGIDFVFALIMLRILRPADYGDYYYAIVIFTWFDTLTNFGLNFLLTREVARDRVSGGTVSAEQQCSPLGLGGAGRPGADRCSWRSNRRPSRLIRWQCKRDPAAVCWPRAEQHQLWA